MVGVVRPADQHPLRAETVEGTGFLIAGGRGLGITARHVANELLAAAPTPDPWTPVSEITELRTPLAGFSEENGDFRSSPIGAIDLHPTEDVALFRLPDQDYFSPYTISADKREASAIYSLWGYPDEVRHDYFTEEQQFLNVSLVYSGGHIRGRLNGETPEPGPRGCVFYELSVPAGFCCSGAPVSLRRDPWRAIGVYVGERRNLSGFAVGFATRAQVLVEQWPQLADPTGDLSGLCPLPPQPPPR